MHSEFAQPSTLVSGSLSRTHFGLRVVCASFWEFETWSLKDTWTLQTKPGSYDLFCCMNSSAFIIQRLVLRHRKPAVIRTNCSGGRLVPESWTVEPCSKVTLCRPGVIKTRQSMNNNLIETSPFPQRFVFLALAWLPCTGLLQSSIYSWGHCSGEVSR